MVDFLTYLLWKTWRQSYSVGLPWAEVEEEALLSPDVCRWVWLGVAKGTEARVCVGL